MRSISITQALLLGFLAVAPFAVGAPVEAGQGLAARYMGGPATNAAKMIREALPVHPPDEFGSWEDKRDVPPPDEFGSWEKRDAGIIARHHTEAQIAAKEAAASAAAAAAAATPSSQCQSKRSPHHTEAQIEAKEQAAAAASSAAAAATATTAPQPSQGCTE